MTTIITNSFDLTLMLCFDEKISAPEVDLRAHRKLIFLVKTH